MTTTNRCTLSPFPNNKGCWVLTPEKKNIGVLYFFGNETLADAQEAAQANRQKPDAVSDGFFLLDEHGARSAAGYPHGNIDADVLFTAFRDAAV